MVPIAEWAGSGTVNVAQNDVEYAFNTSTATASNDTTSFGYGPAGAQIQVITTALVRTVRFQTPIQATDQMTVQVSDDRTKWVDLGPMLNAAGTARIMPYQVQNGTQYGLGEIQVQNATDITVRFGVYSYQGASYGGSGDSWTTPGLMYWRVVKSKSGQAVGFGEVAQNSSGLVKSAGQLKGTNTNDVAATGYVGEVLQSSTSATNFTTSAQYQDAASVTLTAGMWAIYGLMRFTRNGSTFSVTPTAVVGVSTSSGNSGTGLSNGISYTDINNVNTGTTWTAFTLNTPALIVKNDGTTITRVNDGVAYAAGQTLYLKAYIDTFTSGNPQFAGSIMAVRIR
jgi:hypothetical protein